MEVLGEAEAFEWKIPRYADDFAPTIVPEPHTGQLVPARYLLTTKRIDPAITARLYPEHRLYWAEHAPFAVEAAHDVWHVRPGRAVWVPADQPHDVFLRPHDLANVTAFDARLVRVPWASTTATLMPRPQRALLEWGRDNGMARSSRLRLQRTVIDLVLPTSRSRLDLRIPRDLRLARLARSIAADPLRAHSLTEDAARLGLSKRTLTRRFREETGESIGRWRALARIRTALPLLADDVPVWMVAIECGYSTPSAFAAAFRRGLGISPRELFSPADGTDSPPAGPLVRPSFGSAVEFATYED
jgi:AraC-like DNA-binding protein